MVGRCLKSLQEFYSAAPRHLDRPAYYNNTKTSPYWLDDFVKSPGSSISLIMAFEFYLDHCESSGNAPMTMSAFKNEMQSRYPLNRFGGRTRIMGLTLPATR